MKKLANPTPDGVHYFVDFFGCEADQLNSMEFWKEILPKSLEGTSLAVLHSYFYAFKPQGITGFLLLSSSHLSIHTWPENGYLACDIFSCSGDEETKKVVDYLVENIKNSKVEIKKICRGYKYC